MWHGKINGINMPEIQQLLCKEFHISVESFIFLETIVLKVGGSSNNIDRKDKANILFCK